MSYVCTGARVFVPGLASHASETTAWLKFLEGQIRTVYGPGRMLYWEHMLYRVLAFSAKGHAHWEFDDVPALFLEVLVGSMGTERRLIVSDKRLYQRARQAFPEVVASLVEIATENNYFSIELPLLETEEIELDVAPTLSLFGFQLIARRTDNSLASNVYRWYSPRRRALVTWPPDDTFPFG